MNGQQILDPILAGEEVTESDTAPAPALRITDADGPADVDATVRLRAYARVRVERLGAVGKRVRAVAVGDVPSVWHEAPATPAGLVRYAAEGAWCTDTRGFIRGAGRVYHAVVSIPVCLVLYVLALIVQRPGRLTAAVLLALLVWLCVL
jgi:hypothetical protein